MYLTIFVPSKTSGMNSLQKELIIKAVISSPIIAAFELSPLFFMSSQTVMAFWRTILYQVFQVKPCFIFDDKGMYCNNSMWFIPSDDRVLLGILNSKIGWWLISKYCTAIQNGFQLI